MVQKDWLELIALLQLSIVNKDDIDDNGRAIIIINNMTCIAEEWRYFDPV